MEPMVWLVVLVLLIFAFQVLVKLSKKPVEYRYVLRAALLTPAERSFYGVLSSVIETPFTIFAKVRVADVISPEKGLGRNLRQSAFNRISSKHFDFLICREDDLSVVCAIELNDRSHNSNKRQKRDSFLTNACASADLPLIQIPAKRAYNKTDLQEQLQSLLSNQG